MPHSWRRQWSDLYSYLIYILNKENLLTYYLKYLSGNKATKLRISLPNCSKKFGHGRCRLTRHTCRLCSATCYKSLNRSLLNAYMTASIPRKSFIQVPRKKLTAYADQQYFGLSYESSNSQNSVIA